MISRPELLSGGDVSLDDLVQQQQRPRHGDDREHRRDADQNCRSTSGSSRRRAATESRPPSAAAGRNRARGRPAVHPQPTATTPRDDRPDGAAGRAPRQAIADGEDQHEHQPREQANARNARPRQELRKKPIDRHEIDLVVDVRNGVERLAREQPDRPRAPRFTRSTTRSSGPLAVVIVPTMS